MFNYYINREEDVNLKEKVLRKSAITSNVPLLQEVANFGTAYFRLRYYILRNANLNLLHILPFLVTAVNPRFLPELDNAT